MTAFPQASLDFLAGISAHNEKAWFDANRPLYEAGYVAAAKAFVLDIGPRLKAVSPEVGFDPKVNGSIARINRDIRFSKDKRPYKDHLDLLFWHGEKRNWDSPGFWFRLTPTQVMLGCGSFRFEGERLDAFRQSIIHPRSGRALLSAVEAVKSRGDYEIGEKTRKLLPRGYSTGADRQDYLLFEGLYAMITLPAEAALQVDFGEQCMGIYRDTWPVADWLLKELGAS